MHLSCTVSAVTQKSAVVCDAFRLIASVGEVCGVKIRFLNLTKLSVKWNHLPDLELQLFNAGFRVAVAEFQLYLMVTPDL